MMLFFMSPVCLAVYVFSFPKHTSKNISSPSQGACACDEPADSVKYISTK